MNIDNITTGLVPLTKKEKLIKLSDSIHCNKISLKIFENKIPKFSTKEIADLIVFDKAIIIFITLLLLLIFK